MRRGAGRGSTMTGPTASVLVVDDERGFHDLFRFLLEPRGISIDTACDGRTALARLRERSYGLIFCDMHIPGTDSLRLLTEIRTLCPKTGLVLMSSSPDQHAAAQKALRNFEAARHLVKPFELEQLLSALGELRPGLDKIPFVC